MKRSFWPTAALLVLCATEAQAQVIIVPSYGGGSVSGFGFEYRSKRIKIGVFSGGYSSGYVVGPYGTIYDGYGYPYGSVQRNITINVYAPGSSIAAPGRLPDWAADADSGGPSKQGGTTKVNGSPDIGPQPTGPAPEPELPGKDVSVPKPPVRPDDEVEPVKPKDVADKPAEFPRPAPPLAKPLDEANRLIEMGLEEFKAKNYGLAAQDFRGAREVDPESFLARILEAQAEVAFGRFKQAVKVIQLAMKRDKDYPDLKFRPRLSLYKGMEAAFDEHLAVLKDAVKDNPKSTTLLFLLAHQLWFDEQRDAAVELFVRARLLSADPTFVDPFLAAAKGKIIAAK